MSYISQMNPYRYIIVFIFLTLFSLPCISQQITFEKYYDYGYGEAGTSVQQTYDGGYIITGGQGVAIGDYRLVLIKTDSLGQVEWDKFMGSGANENVGNSIEQTTDTGYIITGYTTLMGYAANVYLVKTNPNGDTLWTKHYGASGFEAGYDVHQTFDGGFIIAASKDTTTWLLKTDSNGDTVWTKSFIPLGCISAAAYSVWQTADSGYVFTGVVIHPTTGNEVYVVRTDKSGDTLWTRMYGGAFAERGQSVQQCEDGGFVVAGYTWSFGAGNYDVWLIRTDANGDTLWTKTFGGADEDGGYSVRQTTDGGFIITGSTDTYGVNGTYDVYLIKTDSNGTEQWSRKFGSIDPWKSDIGRCVRQTSDGGYVLTGSTSSFSPTSAVYLIKTDSVGNVALGFHEPEGSTANASITIYPNPFSESATLEITNLPPGVSEVTFLLYDRLGRVLRKFQVPGSGFRIERDGLPAGIYLYRVEGNGTIIGSGKIITQ